MRKSPFLIFAVVVGLLVTGALWFIQSPQFAALFKGAVGKYLPADMGIEGDFSEFAIQLFPPAVSVRNPGISVKPKNILSLPAGTSIRAERVDLTFRLFQMFSGNIRVQEVAIIGGDIVLPLDRLTKPAAAAPPTPPKTPAKKLALHWDELLQVRAEAVSLQNTKLLVTASQPAARLELQAHTLRLAQWSSKAGPGYELDAALGNISTSFPADWWIPGFLQQLQAKVRLNIEGLEIDQLSATTFGMDVRAAGRIKGNILDPQGLLLDAAVEAKGSLTQVRSLLKQPLDADGRVVFEGKVDANLERISETLRAKGSLTVEEVRFQKWRADRLEAEASWSSASSGGELSVDHATVSGAEKARVGATQPAYGGKVEIGAFKWNLGSRQPVSVPVKLERAHIQWLGAPALKEVYPLDFRISGPATLTWTPAIDQESWTLRARTDFAIEKFQLDNQRYGVPRPLKRILAIPQLRLAGELIVDRQGIFPAAGPAGLVVILPHSQLKLAGKIDFRTGWDLYGTGPVSLADLDEIAENKIRGEGTLNAHVHGPSSAVLADFDVDLKDAYYLRLALGSLKGRITWDDDRNHLIFKDAQLARNETQYRGEGFLDLDQANTIDLGFQITRGNIQDFMQIFDELTSGLWWYPRTLNGPFSGSVKLTGGLDLKELVVDTRLNGTEWEFVGERFKQVELVGGYDKGTYQITDLKAVKRNGLLLGKIAFADERRFDWEFRTENFTIVDLDHIAQLDVPVRGRLSGISSGHGLVGAIKADTRISLVETSVRGRPMPPSQLLIRSENGVMQFSGIALGGQGTLELTYDFQEGGRSFLRGEMNHLDFSPLLLLLNPKLSQDPSLAAYASAKANIAFRSGQAERGSGTLEISEYLLRKAKTSFKLAQPVSVRISDGTFSIPSLAIRGNQGEARLSLQGRDATLEGAVTGELDSSIVEFLTSSVAQAAGTARLDFGIAGTLKEPLVSGRAELNGATLRIPAVESPFENITGAFQLRQNVITVQNLEADLAGGRVAAGGTVSLFADRFPTLALTGSLSGNKLKVYPFQYVKVRGNVRVHGEQVPYLIDGLVTIDSALSREKVFNQKQTEGLKSALYMPSARQNESGYPKFRLNVEARADRGIVVQNDLFDAELKGRLFVVNTLEAPRIIGTAELIQGKMVFKNRTFHIDSASASFDNPTVINPTFDLTATTEVNNAKIQMYAAGRLDNWKIELTSNPSMAESDILSLLAMGISPSDVKRMSAGDRSVVEQGEAASLLLHSLDFNREVQSKTGFQIQLGESVDTQAGNSIARPQGSAENAAAPKIVIKRQIGKNLDLSYGSTVGIGSNNRKEVNAEYRVTPNFSVIGVWDNYEAVDAQKKESYGMDLKWQTRFK